MEEHQNLAPNSRVCPAQMIAKCRLAAPEPHSAPACISLSHRVLVGFVLFCFETLAAVEILGPHSSVVTMSCC